MTDLFRGIMTSRLWGTDKALLGIVKKRKIHIQRGFRLPKGRSEKLEVRNGFTAFETDFHFCGIELEARGKML